MIEVVKNGRKFSFPDCIESMERRIIEVEKVAHERVDRLIESIITFRNISSEVISSLEKRVEKLEKFKDELHKS